MHYYNESTPLPPLRHDIAGFETAPGIVMLYDDSLYSDRMARLPIDYVELLSQLDGSRSALDLARDFAASGVSLPVATLLEVVNALEDAYLLDSERFRHHRRTSDEAFNRLPVRPAAHAGSSYPAEPDKLRAMLDGFLSAAAASSSSDASDAAEPIAVIAPHIDFRVGGASYGPAYNALRRSTAETFIILGVSHQMSYDEFMISRKDFDTPLGVMPTDREFIDRFRQRLPFEITDNEIAHRREHSIEFQAVFLRHIFPDREVRIVPILTGSLHEHILNGGTTARHDQRLTHLYEELAATAADLGRQVCYIAGADLCHVGRKFGDDFAARDILEELRRVDAETLEHTARPDADGFLEAIGRVRNRYRVCGVAPIYAAIRASRPTRGEVLCYDQWDESERESAVTFGSVALYR